METSIHFTFPCANAGSSEGFTAIATSPSRSQRCLTPERATKTGWCIGLCLDGRCHSALSDEECSATFGPGSVRDTSPTRSGGYDCGFMRLLPPYDSADGEPG
jgi:hypothetical protein